LNGSVELLLLGEDARRSKSSIADTPEDLQDVSICVGRVGVLRRDNALGFDLRMYKFHRLSEDCDVNDAREWGGGIEGGRRAIALHPNFLPTVYRHGDGAAQHPTLEQFVL